MPPIRTNRHQNRPNRLDRLTFITVVIFGFAGVLLIRLFTLQVLAHGFYETLAQGQHAISQKLIPERGSIFVRDRYSGDQLFPLATNREAFLVFAIPKQIEKPDETAKALAPLLEVEPDDILLRLSKTDDLYEPLKHNVSEATKAAIENLKLPGIEFTSESVRYYPEGNLASQLLGFVGFVGDARQGQYGLEEKYESELAGKSGWLQAERDAGGRWITVGDRWLEEAQDGDDLILTIDRTVEYTVCTKLNEAVKKHGADSGSVVIMDPKTGAVIALCGYPDFDPNKYNEVTDLDNFLNPVTYGMYEPGSVFKPITMAAALDQGQVTPSTTYIDEGSFEVAGYTIKNSDGKAHGEQTMTNVLEESLNTGAIFAEQQIGNEAFYDYVKRFGFGELTGIELDSEAPGNLGELGSGKDVFAATASFGQGITVTPIQLLTAYAAIANGGRLVKPHLIEEIIKPNNFRVKTETQTVRDVINPKTATTLTAMLVNVVKNGHGKRAGVPGYYIAGKTGTAQMSKTDGRGYDANRTIGSFAGFGPVDDPKFVMLVKIDVPRDVQFAESTAAPLFGDIAKFLLNYYEVPPSESVK